MSLLRSLMQQFRADRAEKAAFKRFWQARQTAIYWNRLRDRQEGRI